MDRAAVFGTAHEAVDSGTYLVEVWGELDLHTSPQLKVQMDHVLDLGANWIAVDLLNVPFMDSTALAVLASAHHRLRTEGAISLVCSDHVRKQFERVGFGTVFTLHSSRVDAFEGLDVQAGRP